MEAVQAGKFRIVGVDHVTDAVQATMDKPAGARGEDGKFTPDSVYAIVEAALKETNEKLEGKRGKDKDKGEDKEKEEKKAEGDPKPPEEPPAPEPIAPPPEGGPEVPAPPN